MRNTATRPRTKTKLTPTQVKAYKHLAQRIDTEEQEELKALARDVFRQHGLARQIVQTLRTKRLEQGMSLTELAYRTGIAKSNLSRLENNERTSPTLETLHRYAQALGLRMRVELN